MSDGLCRLGGACWDKKPLKNKDSFPSDGVTEFRAAGVGYPAEKATCRLMLVLN